MKSAKLSLSIAAGVLFAVAGSGAFASDKWLGDQGDNWLEHVKSTKTRAEVKAELKEAREQGLIMTGDTSYPPEPAVKSTRSRAAVRAEAAEAAKTRDRSIEYSSGQ